MTLATTATRRPRDSPSFALAIAEKTRRDSGVDVRGVAGARHERRPSTRCTRRSRRSSTPATRCCCPRPYWTTYPEAISLADGEPVVVPTTEATEFRVTVEQLDAARTPRTKALFFVSPSNPTGAVYPPAEIEGHRTVGRRERRLGDHRRDLRAPDVRQARVHVDAGA